jgi:hypothetical protein
VNLVHEHQRARSGRHSHLHDPEHHHDDEQASDEHHAHEGTPRHGRRATSTGGPHHCAAARSALLGERSRPTADNLRSLDRPRIDHLDRSDLEALEAFGLVERTSGTGLVYLGAAPRLVCEVRREVVGAAVSRPARAERVQVPPVGHFAMLGRATGGVD